jgi:poly(3-hydroxybutyrate) depolymerase
MRRVAPLLLALTACATADDPSTTDDPVAGGDTDTLPEPAAPVAYSGGACPEIVDGANTGFTSAGAARKFQVRLPKDPTGAGVVFLWHGNGDTMSNFARAMGEDELGRLLHAIVVTPEKYVAPGDTFGAMLDWGAPPRVPDTDAALFDDVLSCLDAQFGVDRRRVFSVGFSAGALWTSWLIGHRADHLAAAVVFSGGTDGDLGVNPYATPAWDIPVLFTEGGASDQVVVNFHDMVNNQASQLRRDGSTAIVCSHTQGHTPPTGFRDWSWPFLDAHRYGLEPSPYADGQDPSGELPDTCAWE